MTAVGRGLGDCLAPVSVADQSKRMDPPQQTQSLASVCRPPTMFFSSALVAPLTRAVAMLEEARSGDDLEEDHSSPTGRSLGWRFFGGQRCRSVEVVGGSEAVGLV